MRDVAIVGVGSTQFGRAQWSLLKMMCEASHDAIEDAGIGERKLDAVYVANMGAPRNNRMAGLSSALVDRMNLYPHTVSETIENGPASGASATRVATNENAVSTRE